MNSHGPHLSVLLLTEDGSSRADSVLRLFMVKLLGHLAPGAVTRDDADWWEPANDDARNYVRANSWKNQKRSDHVRVLQYIATKLNLEYGFVFWHIDGDRAYSERATSENLNKFMHEIRDRVTAILEKPRTSARGRKKKQRQAVDAIAEDAVDRIDKLILLMPFYSIEAWLFQNTEVAGKLCPGAPKCRRGCAAKLANWRDDRGALDEVIRPKEALCLGARYNEDLAQERYPLDEVLKAEKSLRDAVDALKNCSALVQVLCELQPHWQR